ncbi:MAG: hypothetical protein KAI79_20055 [Bacteroidales bacterium]|nr:hypothetical protein [Bacteroidales bacterium]
MSGNCARKEISEEELQKIREETIKRFGRPIPGIYTRMKKGLPCYSEHPELLDESSTGVIPFPEETDRFVEKCMTSVENEQAEDL